MAALSHVPLAFKDCQCICKLIIRDSTDVPLGHFLAEIWDELTAHKLCRPCSLNLWASICTAEPCTIVYDTCSQPEQG